ncbi:glycosyltransferase family 4 protein [Patescibacteria group bacterium]|nr:glycosyltransferase family 4 protein [Patescibacteria group bacterium]
MKIDYIANVRIPTEKAHGLQIMKMCEAWGRENKVVLWAPTRINYIKSDPFEFYNVRRNFYIKKILSIDLLPLGNILGKSAFWIQNISFALNSSLRVFFKKTDIIFSRDFWSAYFLSLLGKKVVYEIHDSPSTHPIIKRAFKKIHKFVTTNNFKAQELMNTFGVQKEKILVAPNGVDINFFNVEKSKEDCRALLGLPKDKKIILYTGHLYSWKGADILFDATLKLNRDGTLTVFVGGTPEDVMRFRSRAGFNENVLILGHQEYKKIPYYLGAADVLVLPNTAKERISREETSPIKLFEYMASDRPIIASDIPSIREVVNEREVVFFEPDNPEDLKNKITMVLDNYVGYERLTENAKVLAHKYSWQERAEKILEFVKY